MVYTACHILESTYCHESELDREFRKWVMTQEMLEAPKLNLQFKVAASMVE